MINDNVIKYLCKHSKYDELELIDYLNRLDRVERIANSSEYNGIVHLKNIYYRKYLVKFDDIPRVYNVVKDKWGNEKDSDYIIYCQKQSLDMWLDYLLCTDVNYPQWFKFFVFKGVVKIGAYDEARGKYNKRSRTTIAPFIDIDYEVLAYIYDNLCKFLSGNKLEDQQLEKIIEGADFNKLYNYVSKKVDFMVMGEDTSKQVCEIDAKLQKLNIKFKEVRLKLLEMRQGFPNENFYILNNLYSELLDDISELEDRRFWLSSLVKFNNTIEIRKLPLDKYKYEIYLRNTHECIGEIDYRKFHVSGYIGDIGYHIYKEFRGNGYAYQALELLGEKLYEDNIPNFVISAKNDNIASIKTIEKYGGKLKENVDGIFIYVCDTKPCKDCIKKK